MATRSFGETGVGRDLSAIRPFLWLPLVTTALAVAAALLLGVFASDSGEARFRANVVVDALPPLFGPPVLPGPFDYAALATSDAVVNQVASDTNIPAGDLAPRLRAEPRINTPEIDFFVTGDGALAVATAWERAFAEAVGPATPVLQEQLVQPYREQLEQARIQLAQATLAASAGGPAADQALAAAEQNYETASRLVQSYDVVAATMSATSFTVKAPHTYASGLGSTAARVGAAIAIGLVSGIIGACALAFVRGRRDDDDDADLAPPSIRSATRGETPVTAGTRAIGPSGRS